MTGADGHRQDLAYLHEVVGESPALRRIQGKPLFFVYDSYHISVQDWKTLLSPSSPTTLRGGPMDGVFIGLWVTWDAGGM
jgi:glycoprotein endo-alpha-1,2-mannosidase